MFSSVERSELDGNYAPSVSCVGVVKLIPNDKQRNLKCSYPQTLRHRQPAF